MAGLAAGAHHRHPHHRALPPLLVSVNRLPEQTASCGRAFRVRSYTHSDLVMTKLKILQVGISRRQTSFLVLLLHQSGEEGKIQHEELLHSTISILKSEELPLCLASLL